MRNMKIIINKKVKLGILFILIVVVLLFVNHHQEALSLTSHTLDSSKIQEPVRVLQLTDLHNAEFGVDNTRLIAKCEEQNPDIILMTGDLINMNEPDTDVAASLISALTEIAPVYVSIGNHEIEHEQNFGTDYRAIYEEAGATVLEQEYVNLTINNQPVRLGGIAGYCVPAKHLKTNEADPEECAFLADFQDTDRYTILMCHMPVCWIENEGLDEWDVDCVFSGHAHGGQIILPFVGGLYAPDMGLFPGELQGVFNSKDNTKHLILSRGLGSGTWIPRINNRPEIVTVEIKPQ